MQHLTILFNKTKCKSTSKKWVVYGQHFLLVRVENKKEKHSKIPGCIVAEYHVSHRIFYFSLNGFLSEVVILYCSKASSRVRSVGIFSMNVITDVNMNGMLLFEIKSDFVAMSSN